MSTNQKKILSKDHFDQIITKLVSKLESDRIVKWYILCHSRKFGYENNFLGYVVDGKLVKFIDLLSDVCYFTYSERIEFLDKLLIDAQESIDRSSCSKVILEYYLSRIDDL